MHYHKNWHTIAVITLYTQTADSNANIQVHKSIQVFLISCQFYIIKVLSYQYSEEVTCSCGYVSPFMKALMHFMSVR